MAERLNSVARFLLRYKYVLLILVFILVAGFLDPNSFLARYRLSLRNSELRAEIKECDDAYAAAETELQALLSDPKAVERVARVHLLMKRADEDVYVVESPDSIAPEVEETTEE